MATVTDTTMLLRQGCRNAPLVRLQPYQRMACDFAIAHPRCGLFLPVGAGKTLTTLELLWELDPTTHVLIVGPKAIMQSTWQDEIDKWHFPFRITSLINDGRGRKLSRKDRIAGYGRMAATTLPTVCFMSRDLFHDLVDWHRKTRTDWPYRFVVIDEAQSFKSPSARTRFGALRKVSGSIDRLVELTGTPASNGLLDVWTLMWMIDGGQRLGTTFTRYRDLFFTPTRYVDGRPVDWAPRDGSEALIRRLMAEVCITTDAVRPLMPPVTYNDVTVWLDAGEMAKYKQLAKTQVLEFMDDCGDLERAIAANGAVLRAKLAQLASGTSYASDIDGPVMRGTRRSWGVVHEEKVDALRCICEQAGSPVLVAYRFRCERDLLCDRLKDLGCEAFDGTGAMQRRWNDHEIPVMLIQPASAGFGLNLQYGGHTIVWFSLPESLEQYQQTNGRLARTGQTEPVMIHRLMAKGTVDAVIAKSLDHKADVQDGLLDAINKDDALVSYSQSLLDG